MAGWSQRQGGLEREFQFKDFVHAFAFMTRVALAAERMGHHPEWSNVYRTVRMRLSTHDAGGVVTDKDRELAMAIDALVQEPPE